MAKIEPREGYVRSKRSFIDEVADYANLRRDVVEEVLSAFYDVVAERLINERRLLIPGILSISTVLTKNGIRPEPHLQYRAKVALGLRKLLQRMEADPSMRVDRRNWRSAARDSIPGATGSESSPRGLDGFLNLDEDDF